MHLGFIIYGSLNTLTGGYIYDKILFHPKHAIPVDFEPDNQLFVVPVEDVVAVFRRDAPQDDKD